MSTMAWIVIAEAWVACLVLIYGMFVGYFCGKYPGSAIRAHRAAAVWVVIVSLPFPPAGLAAEFILSERMRYGIKF